MTPDEKQKEINMVAKILDQIEKIREKLDMKSKSLKHITEEERNTFLEKCNTHMTSICFDDPTKEALQKEMQILRKKINKEINAILMKEVFYLDHIGE